MIQEHDGILALQALTLDGIEDLRISTENRVRSLTRDEVDADGIVRGLGLNSLDPRVERAEVMLENLRKLEHEAILEIQRSVRSHPLGDWVKSQKGIGEKQAARLLAAIGDPYWHTQEDRPRSVSELWAYCGYRVDNGIAQRRKKGAQANWSSVAKSRAFLMAESCIKVRSGNYRAVYDEARKNLQDAVHKNDCVRCGPSGHPAKAGTPLSPGHQHARALRKVAKRILRDMWAESRSYHLSVGTESPDE